MKKELQENLFRKYPEFFEYLKKYENGPIMPMRFGFECNDGWYVIIDTLMNSIHKYINSKKDYPDTQIKSKFWMFMLPKVNHILRYRKFSYKLLNVFEKWLKKEVIPAPIVNVIQVKEKYGQLRVYIEGGDEYIDGMIALAEQLSSKTCEFCGRTENVGRTRSWIFTICKDCFDKGLINPTDWKLMENRAR